RRSVIMAQVARVKAPRTVLDIGCGPAILYPDLLTLCERYYAVDLVKANLDEIRRRSDSSKVECICQDLDTFEWDLNYFDVIICSGTVEYTEAAEQNISRLIRCLNREGLLICSFPNAASPYRLWSEFIYMPAARVLKRAIRRTEPSYKRRLFRPTAIARLLELENVQYAVNYIGHKFLPQPIDELFRDLDYRVSKNLQEHPHPLLEKFSTEFVVTVTK